MSEIDQEMRQRIEKLETKISFQESTIEDLSSSLYYQALKLERFERLLRDFASKMKEVAGEAMPPLPQNERPPHY